jgi:hypothetical protein
LASLYAEASSPDGYVKARVDQAGHLVSLRLDDRIRTWPAQRIASTILAATLEAGEAAAAEVRDLLAELGLAGT